jgi:hypothetical protein
MYIYIYMYHHWRLQDACETSATHAKLHCRGLVAHGDPPRVVAKCGLATWRYLGPTATGSHFRGVFRRSSAVACGRHLEACGPWTQSLDNLRI